MSNILKHYGIPGMRWGIRRSTTSGVGGSTAKLGKAKTAADEGSKIAGEGVNITRSLGNAKAAKRKEDLSKLSDDELRSRINRMNLEQQYSNLNGSQVSKGQVYARSALEVTGSVLAIGSSAVAIVLAMKKIKE